MASPASPQEAVAGQEVMAKPPPPAPRQVVKVRPPPKRPEWDDASRHPSRNCTKCSVYLSEGEPLCLNEAAVSQLAARTSRFRSRARCQHQRGDSSTEIIWYR